MKKDRRRKHKTKNIFILLTFGIILGWIVFFDMGFDFSSDTNSPALANDNANTLAPQFFMEGFRTTQFNVDGGVDYEFYGTSAKHFQINSTAVSDDDFMSIVEPKIIFFQSQETPWTLQSNTGKALQQGNLIELSGDVIAWQASRQDITDRSFNDSKHDLKPTNIITEIKTDSLTLKPRDQFAETEKPVMIDYPRAHYEGLGLEVDFAKKLFTLRADVKGVHEPTLPSN